MVKLPFFLAKSIHSGVIITFE